MTSHTFPLTGPINLQVRIGHGAVTVQTADGLTEATVRIEAGNNATELLEQTTIDLRGRTLMVTAPRQGGLFDLPVFGNWRSGRDLDVHVTVPTGTAVKISTVTAPIYLEGTVGGADLAFGSGEAKVGHVAGDLRVRYGSGTVDGEQVDGSVQLRSGSGDATFGEIGGTVNSGSGSGNLAVRIARGAVRWRCGSGTARLGEIHGDVDIASGSGGVEIGLPEGLSVRLDVHTGGGQVRTDLPIEDRPTPNAPAIQLRAHTGRGDVRLFRAA